MAETPNTDETPNGSADTDDTVVTTETNKKKPKKNKFSGAYWYVETDEQTLSKNAFTRTLLTVLAILLQLAVLILPQGGLEFITLNYPSYAYVYMWLVFVMLAVSIFVTVMNFTRYKFVKRIPVERAPKKGFKRRAFFGTELFTLFNIVMLGIEISFVAIHYDGFGLVAVFMCAAAVAAAIAARQITVKTLSVAKRIEAATEN